MDTLIKIKNLPNGYQSVITNGKHAIIGDEPAGTDLGMAPTDLVLGGLALCKVATIRHLAVTGGLDIGNIDAELTLSTRIKDKALNSDVSIKITIDGDISTEQKQELVRKADFCYIHRLLKGNWDIKQELA